MKKILCLILALCLVCADGLAASKKSTSNTKTVLYNAIITRNYPNSTTTVYTSMNKNSKKLGYFRAGNKIQVTAVYPGWVEILYKNGTGYVLRNRVDEVVAVDSVNTPPYGVEKYQFWTVICQETPVLDAPDSSGTVLSTLTEGAKLAIIGVESGWAKCIYHRQYAWVDTRLLDELLPVAEDPDYATEDTPISVFVSFYNTNEDRISNLRVACTRLERTMQPGEELNFNKSVGPFTKANGYLPAPVLIDGQTKQGYGGGSCQISSTLYNTVLQLPGINVLERHPHGASAASYLPHGVDASSGDLNFRIRNDYDFPIRIEASCHDYALFMAIYKE